MQGQLPVIVDVEEIPVRFETFWTAEQKKAFEQGTDYRNAERAA
jgi:hypothetical protein